MQQAIFNRFSVVLPRTMLPKHVFDLYAEIIKDAELDYVYMGEPVKAIQESITGLRLPGLHLNVMTQVKQDLSKMSRLSYYTVRGTSGLQSIADDELILDFRHMQGFHNHLMLFMAINYMQDHRLQEAYGEEFKEIGDISYTEILTPKWSLRTTYHKCVYASIDSIEKRFSSGAEEQTFQVRCKFITFSINLYYEGRLISPLK
jgi:hypothetical protein